ncbi:MAG: DUF4124 domain-containing protein [Pseudomonas sp.]
MRAVLLFALLLPGLATAQIYKWTDAQGAVHFSERPVQGATEVEVKPQVMERDDSTRQREERTQNFYKARRDERAVAEQRAQKAGADQAKTCHELRNELRSFPPGRAYYSLNDKGERVYYSDQQLDAARRQLGERIAQECD